MCGSEQSMQGPCPQEAAVLLGETPVNEQTHNMVGEPQCVVGGMKEVDV